MSKQTNYNSQSEMQRKLVSSSVNKLKYSDNAMRINNQNQSLKVQNEVEIA